MLKISNKIKNDRYPDTQYTVKNMLVELSSFWAAVNITIFATAIYMPKALSSDYLYSELFNPSMAIWLLTITLLLLVIWLFFLSAKKYRLAQQELKQESDLLKREVEKLEQTNIELQQTRKSAEAASVTKNLYLERISHELRTPLNSVMGYAQLLEDAEDIPPLRRESIKVMRSSSEHLTDLIEGLIDISKIEAGRLDLHRNEVDLFGMLEQLVFMFKIQAK